MSIVIFSDLDDSMVQSERKTLNKITAEVISNGKTSSHKTYITQQQQKLLSLFKQYTFIPVTGRDFNALTNLTLNLNSYKIIDHGCMILDADDQIIPESQKILDTECPKWEPIFIRLHQQVQEAIQNDGYELRTRLIYDRGHFCYLSIKGNIKCINRLKGELDLLHKHPECKMHINDRNMALMPPYASKINSVKILQQHYQNIDPHTLFVGLGDSLTDLPFMQTCHFTMMPSNCQITEETQ